MEKWQDEAKKKPETRDAQSLSRGKVYERVCSRLHPVANNTVLRVVA
jgi:hypothetical protein